MMLLTQRTDEAPRTRAADDELYGRLLSNRIVFLGQEVDDEISNRICSELLLLSAEDPRKDICLYINSPGGSVTAGMAIYGIMQYVPNDIVTVAMGFAASMGQFLLCAGTPGKRYALPYTQIVMHQPHGGVGGTATDVRIMAAQMARTKRTLAERIAFHTGQPVERIERDGDRDRWFTAEEAREYGIIDQVVANAEQVAAPVS